MYILSTVERKKGTNRLRDRMCVYVVCVWNEESDESDNEVIVQCHVYCLSFGDSNSHVVARKPTPAGAFIVKYCNHR